MGTLPDLTKRIEFAPSKYNNQCKPITQFLHFFCNDIAVRGKLINLMFAHLVGRLMNKGPGIPAALDHPERVIFLVMMATCPCVSDLYAPADDLYKMR